MFNSLIQMMRSLVPQRLCGTLRSASFRCVIAKPTKLLGTLTDRDIAVRLVAEGREAAIPISDVMTTAPIFCHSHDDIDKARDLMESHQVSRVIVLDDNDGLAGIISLADVADDQSLTVKPYIEIKRRS